MRKVILLFIAILTFFSYSALSEQTAVDCNLTSERAAERSPDSPDPDPDPSPDPDPDPDPDLSYTNLVIE